MMLNLISLHGVKGICHVFLMNYDRTVILEDGRIVSGRDMKDEYKEWVLETDATT